MQHELQEIEQLSAKEVKQHVLDHRFSFENFKNIGPHVRCIDGREDRLPGNLENPLPEIARPGGGLGYALVALGALKKLGLEGNQRALEAVEDVLGKEITMHTDTHEHHDDIPCAGCGHIMAAVDNPQAYGLDERGVALLKKYAGKIGEREIAPAVYNGAHEEAGVVIIDAKNVGVPPRTESGGALYVYNRANDQEIIGCIAVQISKKFPKASLRDIQQAMGQINDLQNTATLKKLAGNLPKFSVSEKEGELIVEEIS